MPNESKNASCNLTKILEDCPFCDMKPSVYGGKKYGFWIRCHDCRYELTGFDKKELINKWNFRKRA